MFSATTPENTPLAYRASTPTNPNHVINPAFLEYSSEDYDEEREMKPRPEPVRAATPPIRAASPRVCRRSIKREWESKCKPSSTLSSPHREKREWETFVVFPDFRLRRPGESFANLPQGGHVPLTFTNGSILPQNGFTHPANIPPNSYPFYTKPMYTFPNMAAYANLNSTSLFPNLLGSVTPFVRWIEDYPLPDELKMPSHIGSYDGKGDPDNFLHLFEGAIRMQKWLMPVACHMFTYTLKDSARIWWNSQKAGSILDYEDLKAKF
ncbi:hypothetical protein Tco_0620963 [Tanacetum coccineum]